MDHNPCSITNPNYAVPKTQKNVGWVSDSAPTTQPEAKYPPQPNPEAKMTLTKKAITIIALIIYSVLWTAKTIIANPNHAGQKIKKM